MSKKNCWEFKKCGRGPNATMVDELGECPASTEKTLDGIHDGINAGRACWIVAGTMCGDKKQGIFARKYESCQKCDFYKSVKREEGVDMMLATVMLSKLHQAEADTMERAISMEEKELSLQLKKTSPIKGKK